MGFGGGRRGAWALALGLLACQAPPTAEPEADSDETGDARAPGDTVDPSLVEVPPEVVEAPPAPPPYTPPSSLGPATEIRLARRTRSVYAGPDRDAPARGRIPANQRFHVYATADGPGCDRPWAQVADDAWTCLERTELSEDEPTTLPTLRPGANVPFIYARHRRHRLPDTPAIPVYASLSDLAKGADPIDSLPAYGSYAFTRRSRNNGAAAMITHDRKIVPADDLRRFEPSEFRGRDLVRAPLPADVTLAWGLRWKTKIRARPDVEAEVVAQVDFHGEVELSADDGQLDGDGERWFPVASGGWVRDEDVRRWQPVAPDAPVLGDQITIDIDLDEQVLTVWREVEPVFATMISSGKPGDRTPVGTYRITTKWAYGKMASLPSSDDPYYVAAVPWAMYFTGRYALHAAYWHDKFGHRMSHGCVNLSPADARHVFELATPTLHPGWLLVHEAPADPGAVIRIRERGREGTDRRKPLAEPVDRSATIAADHGYSD